ncbi:hypothetical protein AN167_07210 [Vibrio splendidus]|nr:hypothetical protein AN167_07210 [Vibrio splendidus]USN27223.1 hypothetical protein [synthetic construct]
MVCVLPHRQLRIGQEESNQPAEQAVKIKAIKFKLGGFFAGFECYLVTNPLFEIYSLELIR